MTENNKKTFTKEVKTIRVKHLLKILGMVRDSHDMLKGERWLFDTDTDAEDCQDVDNHLKAAEDVLRDLICRVKCRSTEE